MLGYIENRGGVEHELHIKYSEVITVFFITLMYGPGIPFMYVIATIHYFIYYSVQRWTLVRTIKRPANMGDDLIVGYIGWMQWAPLLYLYMALRMLSNKQMFDGWVYPRDSVEFPMETGHTWLSMCTLN